MQKAKPFIKWAGGKSKLITQFLPHIPSEIKGTYHEPFLGGGAMFFHLQPQKAVLSDINPKLVNTYIQVRDNVSDIIDLLKEHQSNHSQQYYYKIRDRYNSPTNSIESAAQFIYLNKTGFNGLHRENKSGGFNVPIGRSKTPWIVDEDGLKAASQALHNAEIVCRGIKDFPDELGMGDFVYLDPPYQSVSKTSNFTSYCKDGFTEKDQEYLQELFHSLSMGGIAVALSNSDCEYIRKLYNGSTIHDIQASRCINSKGDKRGNVGEVLITANC